jgi:hypothetical protein
MCFRLKYYYACWFWDAKSLVKFYSQCKNRTQSHFYLYGTVSFIIKYSLDFNRDIFLSKYFCFLVEENPIVKDYLWLIPSTGLCMAYFEIFYAWARVNMHSVFGNFIKEVGLRFFSSCWYGIL